ncbi:MAG TPA: hypothetical protein VHL09_17460, partial [Dehalococcoidia bacterium]|nr:hypothetical protein [Dehalococcoidia bacterium]
RYRFLARFGSVILSGGIAAVPRALYYYQAELGLLPQEAWFVGYILAHRWTAELPYPSLRKMARRTGVTYQMLHRYKNSLIAKNYLQVIPRSRQNGGRTTNSYDFSGLFQAIETLLLRDRGQMDEVLDAADPDPEREDLDPGQPELIGPDPSGLTRPGKPRLTGPDAPRATTRRDSDSTQIRAHQEPKTTLTMTTTTRAQHSSDVDLTMLLDLYAAANGRAATPLQARSLADLRDDLDRQRGPGAGADWLAEAIREAADAGSGYLSPRRLRRICERWLRDGRPGEKSQSATCLRTKAFHVETDWHPLSVEKWKAAVDRLARALSPANFQAFIAPVRPLGQREDRVCLGVPDELTAQRLGGSFRSVVEAALTTALDRRVAVECRVVPRPGRSGARAEG